MPKLEERLDLLQQAESRGILVYNLNGTRMCQAEPILYANGVVHFYHLQGTLQAWLK